MNTTMNTTIKILLALLGTAGLAGCSCGDDDDVAADADTDVDTDTDSDMDTDTESDTDTGTESDTDTDTGTESDTGDAPTFADLSGAEQLDRMGKPAFNTALLPGNQKEAFNANTDPSLDGVPVAGGGFLDHILAQASGPDLAVNTSALWEGALLADAEVVILAGPLLAGGGDVLVLDTAGDNGYVIAGGGRQPADDVIDITLDGITANSLAAGNAAGVASDEVDANDAAFDPAFPYFADPN